MNIIIWIFAIIGMITVLFLIVAGISFLCSGNISAYKSNSKWMEEYAKKYTHYGDF